MGGEGGRAAKGGGLPRIVRNPARGPGRGARIDTDIPRIQAGLNSLARPVSARSQAVRLAAAGALRFLVDDFGFEPAQFVRFAGPCVQGLLKLAGGASYECALFSALSTTQNNSFAQRQWLRHDLFL